MIAARSPLSRSVAAIAIVLLMRIAAAAQTAQPAAKPPDDTPSIRVGATLFADYTLTQKPETLDVDDNSIKPSSFNIGRCYLTLTGQISHLVAFRITPDIARETGPGSTLTGSYTFRLKYAYAQFNLDDWMGRGTWVRLGMQPTPYVNYIEDIYRYRFQGTIMSDREGFLSSSDVGATFHYNFPGNYGDVHGGFYNGETYSRFETNDQKALQVRASLRPLRSHPVLRGFRLAGFYDGDAYVQDAERRRIGAAATFEHARLVAGAEFLDATDQTRRSASEVDARGFSLWATPRAPNGWEALLRYDQLTPNRDREAKRRRTIVGAAYWFPKQGNVSSALLFDVEQVDVDDFVPPQSTQRRFALHALVNF